MVETGSSAQLPLWICAFHYFYYKYSFNFANTTSDEFLNIYIYMVILCQGFLWIFHETCCQNTCLLDLNICTWISQGSSKIPLISFPYKPTLPPIFFISNRHNSSHESSQLSEAIILPFISIILLYQFLPLTSLELTYTLCTTSILLLISFKWLKSSLLDY